MFGIQYKGRKQILLCHTFSSSLPPPHFHTDTHKKKLYRGEKVKKPSGEQRSNICHVSRMNNKTELQHIHWIWQMIHLMRVVMIKKLWLPTITATVKLYNNNDLGSVNLFRLTYTSRISRFKLDKIKQYDCLILNNVLIQL